MKRFLSLDILRGLTVAGMILVNNQGPGQPVSFLHHASGNGCTPADLVFPFFLFIVGAASWFAMKKTNHELTLGIAGKILKRGVLIFLVGMLIINYFPFTGPLSEIRIPGVLQRIAVVYVISSFLVLWLKDYRKIIGAAVLLLSGYWTLLYFGGGYGLEESLIRKVDLAVFGEAHMYRMGGISFDPEGLLSNMPAVVNALLGYLFAMMLDRMSDKKKAVALMGVGGAFLIGLGALWSLWFPLNKVLWSSSFVLYTSGWCAVIWSILSSVTDIWGKQRWTTFFRVFGTNALFAYVLSCVLGVSGWIFPFVAGGEEYSVGSWLYKHLWPAGDYGQLGSVFWGLFILLITWVITWLLYRKKIFIRL